jgi:ABC-type glycerol-3-phosphate transport system substrate-binding protein
MKKLFLILAASAVLFACGGGNKKAPTVEEKAVEYTKQIMELEESGDYEKLMELAEEMEAWAKGLTPEEQERADEAILKYLEGVDPEFAADEEYYDDEEEYYYDEDEEYYEDEEFEMSSSEWDEVLDEYEEYVDEYIELYKDAMAGDMDAMTELAEMSEDLAEFATEVGEVADQLTIAQANRFNKIAQKLANALN